MSVICSSHNLGELEDLNRQLQVHCYGWPPDCVGYIYQPERPVQQKEAHTANEAQKLAADE